MFKFLAVVVLGLLVGTGGAALSESGDHQEQHIQKIEAKWR